MATIREIAEEIDHRAHSYSIGKLQEVRRQIKGLSKLASHRIFAPRTVFERWAFHFGGRTELQFNIGFETVDDINYVRHGVDSSSSQVRRCRTLPRWCRKSRASTSISGFFRTTSRISECGGTNSRRAGPDSRRSILADIVRPKVFVFLGALGPVDSPDYDRILADFDRLLPLYRYVEGQAPFPELVDPRIPFRFEPGVRSSNHVRVCHWRARA